MGKNDLFAHQADVVRDIQLCRRLSILSLLSGQLQKDLFEGGAIIHL